MLYTIWKLRVSLINIQWLVNTQEISRDSSPLHCVLTFMSPSSFLITPYSASIYFTSNIIAKSKSHLFVSPIRVELHPQAYGWYDWWREPITTELADHITFWAMLPDNQGICGASPGILQREFWKLQCDVHSYNTELNCQSINQSIDRFY